ncbi:MAG: S1/P1 nuclease [Pseudoxanthomonas sp.]
MRRLSLLVVLLGFWSFLAPDALAWSKLGHRLVGDLAQRHLNPAASAQVALLLAGEPDPTLAGVASWADDLRRSDADEFEKKTASWHYINFPVGTCVYLPERDCPDGNCVVGQIEHQRAILADRSRSMEVRRDALKFLVHLVGDVHQPLHSGNHTDKGGNDFQVSLRTDLKPGAYAQKDYVDGVMGTNLHSIWDYYIFGSTGLSFPEYSERLAAQPWPPQIPMEPLAPAAWATESCQLLDSHHLYAKSHKMDSRYLDAQRPLAERQVEVAAMRLADLLDSTLGN